MVVSWLSVVKVTDVRLEEYENESIPTDVTDAGIWTSVIFVVAAEAPAMITTPSCIVNTSAGLPTGY